MDDLAQLIANVVFAVAATVLAHLGVQTDDVELRAPKPQAQRVIKRSHVPDRPSVVFRPAL